MREILFKAKSIAPGEWVEGYVFDDGIVGSNRMFVGGLVITDYKGSADDDWEVGLNFCEVIPETICQYTGLPAYWLAFENEPQECDVWEHDLLEVDYNGRKVIAEVKFEGGMFILVSNEFVDSYISLFDVVQVEDDYWIDAKVVGNIFDNADLLQ